MDMQYERSSSMENSAKGVTFESGAVSGKLGSVFKNFRDLEVQNPDGSKTVYKK